MQLHFFIIPVLNSQAAQAELNRFCAAHRVVAIDRHFVAAGENSYWALCVSIEAGANALPDVLKAPEHRGNGTKPSTDYRQVLSEADFAVFARLRTWRKQTAEHEGVPPYAVFTNEQLAEMAKRRVASLAALGEISGIGRARLERYGAAALSCVGQASNGDAT